MTLLDYKLIAALVIFLVSIATTIYPLKKRLTADYAESFQVGEALASGIFLGAALFHLLPDAVKLFALRYPLINYPIPEVICAAGFLILLFLERCSVIYTHINPKDAIPYVLVLMLTVHAIVEGAALGIGGTLTETVMLFIAIAAHKGSESFALAITMLKHKMPIPRIIVIIILFSCMTPLGIFLGAAVRNFSFSHTTLLAASFNAFAAGTFLYIATLHHVHAHHPHEEEQGNIEFSCFTIGIMMMGLIAFWT